MRRKAQFAAALALGLFLISSWLAAAEYRGVIPEGNYEPHRLASWLLTGPDAASQRLDAIARATFELPADAMLPSDSDPGTPGDDPLTRPVPSCRFLPTEPSGTTPKFDCVLAGGDIVKVKYGRNPEIQAEAAATKFLGMLGYPADSVIIVPRLRCYGCPRYPFFTSHLQTFGIPLLTSSGSDGYTDFEWVAVERKLPLPAIETETAKGFAWWELKRSRAPRADLDALRLTAIFLAHWDNKSENQRLVCLDAAPPSPGAACERPLGMLQDLGATFGPLKVNVARWHDLPVWHDRDACTVSMRALPFAGATFPDARISEAGRRQFASRIAWVTDSDIERMFAEAQFAEFQVGTPAEQDLEAWSDAFRHRRDQIVNREPCSE